MAVSALERAEFIAALDRLAGLPDAMRQAVADQQWAQIPLTVNEAAYSAVLADGSALAAPPQTAGLELIESVVATVPTGATGLLQLGSVVVPCSPGLTLLAPVRFLLHSSDVRTLTISGASGPAALVLCGVQLPTFGVLAP